MGPVAVFVRHRVSPGQRDVVQALWREHLAPAVAGNPGHHAYAYCTDDGDPDVVCAFQVYSSGDAARAFLQTPAYREYEDAVRPFLQGPPEVTTLRPVWTKGLLPR